MGEVGPSPAVHLVQPEGCNTIATCLREGRDNGEEVAEAHTAITGIKVPMLLDAAPAIAMARSSGGTGFLGSDEEIYAAQARLALEEGILAEPAGAASVVAALKVADEGVIREDQTSICFITGSAFNDEGAFSRMTDSNHPGQLAVDDLAAWTDGSEPRRVRS